MEVACMRSIAMFVFRHSHPVLRRTIRTVRCATTSSSLLSLMTITSTTRLQQLQHHLQPRLFATATKPKMPTTRQQDNKVESELTSRMKKDVPGAKPVEKSHRSNAKDCTEFWEDEDHLEQNKKDFQEFRTQHHKSSPSGTSAASGSDSGSGDHGEVPGGMKRGRGANQVGNQSKKPRSENGDMSHLPTGDKTRVPAVGQSVQWKSGQGYAKGEVVEVLYEEKEVEGEKVEASKEDPRLVLETESSGKISVHKPEDVYFD